MMDIIEQWMKHTVTHKSRTFIVTCKRIDQFTALSVTYAARRGLGLAY